jgi:alpha-methylacyl-CoA racemase
MHRGRRSIALNLRELADRETLLALVERADVVVESYRPGVAERLGIGPEVCQARNPRLVYARMTGWGQTGPLAQTAGHDIDYIALAGALDNFRRAGEVPVPPLNMVGDLGGGGMMLAFGIAAALVQAARTGKGEVLDVAMVDGVALQLSVVLAMRAQGRWTEPPGGNSLDTGAPFYEVYPCADSGFMAVGAIEAQFYATFLQVLGVDAADLPAQGDKSRWPEVKQIIAAAFRTRTRAEWTALFDGTDSCCVPVLSLDEAFAHPHIVARGTFVERDGVVQPAPAPRFGDAPAALPALPPIPGTDRDEVLRDWEIE